MTIRKVPYPTDTRKFEVRHNGHDYICYIPGAFNCLGASVWEGGKMIDDARLAIQIELACRSAMR